MNETNYEFSASLSQMQLVSSSTPCFRKKHPLTLLAISWAVVIWF